MISGKWKNENCFKIKDWIPALRVRMTVVMPCYDTASQGLVVDFTTSPLERIEFELEQSESYKFLERVVMKKT